MPLYNTRQLMVVSALLIFGFVAAVAKILPEQEAAPSFFIRPQCSYELKGDGIREGYYFFTEEKTADELLSASSGAEPGKAPEQQASAKIKSGSRVTFGSRVQVEDMGAPARINFFLPLSVNAASAEDLTMIPGVGMQTAQAIIDYRNIHNGIRDVQELKAVKGFGEKKLQALGPYLME